MRYLALLLCIPAMATNIYVSSTTRPIADGRNPDTPLDSFANVQAMIAETRANGGDVHALLFERGSVFEGGLGVWAQGDILIGAYGDERRPRPVFRCQQFVNTQGALNNLTITDLDIQHAGAEANGLQLLGGGDGLTIRNCRIAGFLNNINVQGYRSPWRNVLVEDCVILDATSGTGRAQGIYAENAHGVTIRGCIFDRNGTSPSTQSHGVYVHALCAGLAMADNVFSRSAATGLQARPGGVVIGNVFLRNPISLTFGYVLGGSDPTPGGVPGEIVGNVIVDGTDISPAPNHVRGIGMQVGNLQPGVVIRDNLIAHSASSQPWEAAIQFFMQQIEAATVTNNLIVDWNAVLFLTSEPMPEGFDFRNNTIHRVRYPAYHPLLFMRTYQDEAWRTVATAANTLIESRGGRVYTSTAGFDDFAGLRAGQYDAQWLREYFQRGYDVLPPVAPAEMVVTVPAGTRRVVIEIE